jgi:hypothetical protein
MHHIAEGARAQNKKIDVTEVPVYFTKPPTAVIGPDAEIPYWPSLSTAIDYEVEMAVMIGKPGINIPKGTRLDHIFGYTILNDITARDVQRRHGGQYFKGKGAGRIQPDGPGIVTADAMANPGIDRDPAVGQRREAPGQHHEPDDLRHPHPDRVAVRRADAGTGRHHRHRHAFGCGLCDDAAAFPEGRGRGDLRS